MSLPPITEAVLRNVCAIIADTECGYTNREIGRLLEVCEIPDPTPQAPEGYYTAISKRDRLFNSLSQALNTDKSPNKVYEFIQTSMDPARNVDNSKRYQFLLDGLNKSLSFIGIAVGDDGNLKLVEKAKTLSDAEKRANSLRSKLEMRNTHPLVLQFCREELLYSNYFHVVLEAAKSLSHSIRDKSNLTNDGVTLIEEAFGTTKTHPLPLLAINKYQSDTEKNEHHGLRSLLIGITKMFRNPTAHEPKIFWSIDEQDALDILATISFAHRKLEKAVKTGY